MTKLSLSTIAFAAGIIAGPAYAQTTTQQFDLAAEKFANNTSPLHYVALCILNVKNRGIPQNMRLDQFCKAAGQAENKRMMMAYQCGQNEEALQAKLSETRTLTPAARDEEHRRIKSQEMDCDMATYKVRNKEIGAQFGNVFPKGLKITISELTPTQ